MQLSIHLHFRTRRERSPRTKTSRGPSESFHSTAASHDHRKNRFTPFHPLCLPAAPPHPRANSPSTPDPAPRRKSTWASGCKCLFITSFLFLVLFLVLFLIVIFAAYIRNAHKSLKAPHSWLYQNATWRGGWCVRWLIGSRGLMFWLLYGRGIGSQVVHNLLKCDRRASETTRRE